MSEMVSKENDDVVKSGKKIPYYIALFFIVLAICDGVFVYLAISSKNGVVTENAYEKGLNYNSAISQAEEASKNRQDIIFVPFEDLPLSGEIKYIIHGLSAEEMQSLKVKLIAERPINNANGFEQLLDVTEHNNIYSNNVSFEERGIWDILIIAKTKTGSEYRKKQRIFVER